MRGSKIFILVILALVACAGRDAAESPLFTAEFASPLPTAAVQIVRQPVYDHFVHLPFVSSPSRLLNSDFEGGQWQRACWTQWPWATVYCGETFDEVRPPEGWTAWWANNAFCPYYEDYRTGRPEVAVVGKSPDRSRVYEGKQAAKAFSFWRCHLMGLYQRVWLTPGTYRFSVMAHLWYTDCSDRPHDPPYEADCETPIGGVSDWGQISLGIDPVGWEWFDSDYIYWSTPAQLYGKYSVRLYSPWTPVSREGWVTFWIKSKTSRPLRQEDLYLDAAELERK